jgi:hypothetical protein
MKAGTVEPEDTAVARQWLCKHVSTATNSHDRGNRYARNDRIAVGSGVLCWVCAESLQAAQHLKLILLCSRTIPVFTRQINTNVVFSANCNAASF